MKKLLLLTTLVLGIAAKAQYIDLHDFILNNDSGYSSLTISGNTIYGSSRDINLPSGGFIYSMKTNGTGFTHICDSVHACGSLLLNNGILYGMGGGRIYKLDTNGIGFTTLHIFTGTSTDGGTEQSSLILSGNVLYGMTRRGGANGNTMGGNGYGVIFSIQTNGSNFTILYNFTALANYPYGSLTLVGGILYGMTSGTAIGNGNIFSINTNGTNYTNLYSFGTIDAPNGSLITNGNTLFGLTKFGGTNGKGNIFKIKIDGTGYQNLYNCNNYPYGSLTLVGGVLYGMTANNLFSIDTNGVGYTWYNSPMYGQIGTPSLMDRNSNLTLNNGLLYGQTNSSSGPPSNGIIFSFTPTSLTSINDLANLENSFTLYPNPSNGSLIMTFSGILNNNEYILNITNVIGKVVYSLPFRQQQNEIDLSNLNKGIYFLSLLNKENSMVEVKKIVLQ